MTETGICSHNLVFWLLDTIYLFLPIWVGTGFQVLPMFEIEWHPHRTTWYLPSGFTDKVAPQKLPRKRKKKEELKICHRVFETCKGNIFFSGGISSKPKSQWACSHFFFFLLMTADSLGDHKPLWVESVWRTVTTVCLMDTERDQNDCEPQGVSGYLCVVPISLGV